MRSFRSSTTLVAMEPPALQGLPVGVHRHGEAKLVVLDVAVHGLDIEGLGVLVVVHANHEQAAAAVLLVETVQGRRGGAAERAARSMNQRTSTTLPRRSSSASGSELNQCSAPSGRGLLMMPLSSSWPRVRVGCGARRMREQD